MKTLIVDDCPIICATMSKLLKKWGFEPVVANDGRQALEIASAAGAPRLLIVDWKMPGMSGLELIRTLRDLDCDRRSYIIMLTAETGAEALDQVFGCGADDYLPKPIVEDEVHRRIREGENILERHDAVVETCDRLSQASK